MTKTTNKFSPEVRGRAVRMVLDGEVAQPVGLSTDSHARFPWSPHWDDDNGIARLPGLSHALRFVATIRKQDAGSGQAVVHDRAGALAIRCPARSHVRPHGAGPCR
ncbi:MAG: hypothetical protein FJX25_15025 [Alphaproteobacteria bacterium]|nr:hypothetical protein [Alphaproteobacteria bacterium]